MCFDFRCLFFFSETFLVLRKIERDIIKNILYIGIHVISPLVLSNFNERLTSSTFDVFSSVDHSIELFHLPTLMHNSLFINNMFVTLLSPTCFEY